MLTTSTDYFMNRSTEFQKGLGYLSQTAAVAPINQVFQIENRIQNQLSLDLEFEVKMSVQQDIYWLSPFRF